MPDGVKRLIIVDQSLKDFDGHHFEYDIAVAEAAQGVGLRPYILSHVGFVPAENFPAQVTPWFSASSYEAARSPLKRAIFNVLASLPECLRRALIGAASRAKRLVSGSWRVAPVRLPLPQFGARLMKGLMELRVGAGDHVLVHTVTHAELHALAASMRDRAHGPEFHIVLRRDAEEADPVSQARGGLLPALSTIISEGDGNSVHLYADTVALADQYNALLGTTKVSVLPIPHCLATGFETGEPRPTGPLRLVYLGNARTEKGFDQLATMVAELRPWFEARRVRLVAQANIPVSLEEATVAKAVSILRRYPSDQVELIIRPLSVAEFQGLLGSADIVLLPYSFESYRRRSSGILVQAAVAGKPTVVPACSWLALAAPSGAAVEFGPERTFGEAVRLAVEGFDQLSVAARAAAPAIAEAQNANRLVEILLEKARAVPDISQAGLVRPPRGA